MIDSLIIDCLTSSAWALHEPVLRSLSHVVLRHAAGVKLSATQIQQVVQERNDKRAVRRANAPAGSPGVRTAIVRYDGDKPAWTYDVVQGIAVIGIEGVIVKHASLVNGVSQEQGTSCEQIRATVCHALDEPGVKAIVLDFYSPGGSVDGVADTADLITRARQVKPIVAQVSDFCASAAYWLASQCDAIAINLSGSAGSIGVYSVLHDVSRLMKEDMKCDVYLVKGGDDDEDNMKGIGVPGIQITDKQRAEVKRGTDALYDIFVAQVARGRGMSVEATRALADGRMHTGADAVKLGLADKVSSLDETLGELVEQFRT